MLSDDKYYEVLASLIADRTRSAIEAFKLYISLYSAIVGGTIWLSTQTNQPKSTANYVLLSDMVVVLVTFVAMILVFEAMRGWRACRVTQSEIVAKGTNGKYSIPPPKLFPSGFSEGAMLLCMLIACAMFICFNPLGPIQ